MTVNWFVSLFVSDTKPQTVAEKGGSPNVIAVISMRTRSCPEARTASEISD
ncbi:MAG TPA: hypothetical protein VGQ76_16215 [Thermoanaerobaculia bacterium]|jgi:hypothetical protein|nr:hypothetical protein [Thermoanaerobaculia bacterium]